MTDWTAGYVADIDYIFGYYAELNPLRIKLAFLNAGLVSPEIGTACELGFGQGLSVNLHAAASITQWYGTDFNPSQAGFAQDLATASGTNARLYDEAFADFANRADLPEFDFIAIHGIWSWISDENRAVIVAFIRKRLKVGGVLYISYNTQPGWAAFAPMRHLMTEHAETNGAEGQGIVSRINGALDFTEKLLATNPIYARANPHIADRFQKIKGQNRNYLAHEFFNRDWHPMHFGTMAKWLEPAKLNYACSAHYLDHLDTLNLTSEQQGFLKETNDTVFREAVRDFMVNQQFRKDYWVKGLRRLNSLEKVEDLCCQRVILTQPRADVSLKVSGAIGEATLQDTVYAPILDVLADHQPKSLGQIEQAVTGKGIVFAQIREAVMVLIGGAIIYAVQNNEVIATAKKQTDKINAHIIKKARGSSEINYLASPVIGCGIAVSRFPQLFLLAISQGKNQPAELAQYAWQILSAQGQKLLQDGKTLETEKENLAELTKQALVFVDKQFTILKALGIA